MKKIILNILFFVVLVMLFGSPIAYSCSKLHGVEIEASKTEECPIDIYSYPYLRRMEPLLPTKEIDIFGIIDFYLKLEGSHGTLFYRNCFSIMTTLNKQEKKIFRNIFNPWIQRAIEEEVTTGRALLELYTAKKQSQKEYASFLKEVAKINASSCSCYSIRNIERHGYWTFYRGHDRCSYRPDCSYIRPWYCPQGWFSAVVHFIAKLF